MSSEHVNHQRQNVVDQHLGQLLQNWQERPSVQQIQQLVIEYDIAQVDLARAANKNTMPLPDMTVTLHEIRNLLPYFQQLNHTLSNAYPQATLLFLGRDAEYLHDAYYLMEQHEQQQVVLLPGSRHLWASENLNPWEATMIPALSKKFLETYGITEEKLNKGEQFVVIDSGFMGTISKSIQDLIARLYPHLEKDLAEQFVTRLVSHDKRFSYMSPKNTAEICSFPPLSNQEYLHLFPRARRAAPESISAPIKSGQTNYVVATAMQILPHHHREFEKVAQKNEGYIGVPLRRSLDSRINTIEEGNINASYVHPAAALSTQLELIKSII